MRVLIPVLAIALAACGQNSEVPAAEPSTPEIATAEANSPPPEMPMRLADPEADIEAIAEQVMASVNPLENDLSGLEVAVRLRDEFRITESGVEFQLKVVDGAGLVPLEESVKMVETTGVESPTLIDAQREGFFVRTYELAPEDQPKFGAAYKILQAMKQTSTGDNELTFNAVAHSCVEPAVPAPDQYSLTMYVRTHPDVDFVTLSQEWVVERGAEGVSAAMFATCDS